MTAITGAFLMHGFFINFVSHFKLLLIWLANITYGWSVAAATVAVLMIATLAVTALLATEDFAVLF